MKIEYLPSMRAMNQINGMHPFRLPFAHFEYTYTNVVNP